MDKRQSCFGDLWNVYVYFHTYTYVLPAIPFLHEQSEEHNCNQHLSFIQPKTTTIEKNIMYVRTYQERKSNPCYRYYTLLYQDMLMKRRIHYGNCSCPRPASEDGINLCHRVLDRQTGRQMTWQKYFEMDSF